MTIPAVASRRRTAKESSGVDRGPEKTNASQPFSAAIRAAKSANSREKNRVSSARTSVDMSANLGGISRRPMIFLEDVFGLHRGVSSRSGSLPAVGGGDFASGSSRSYLASTWRSPINLTGSQEATAP